MGKGTNNSLLSNTVEDTEHAESCNQTVNNHIVVIGCSAAVLLAYMPTWKMSASNRHATSEDNPVAAHNRRYFMWCAV